MKTILIIILLLVTTNGYCADRYWVDGGSDTNWNATGDTNWGTASGVQDDASVPGASDACIFDANSAGAAVGNVDTTIASLDFTGFTGTFTHAASSDIKVAGSITLVSGMTYTLGSTWSSKFWMTGSGNFTTGGQTMGGFEIDATGQTNTLQDAWTGTSNGMTYLTKGKWDTNDQTVTIDAFSSDSANTRALDLGSTTFTVDKAASTSWDISNSTNMTLTPGTSSIIVSGNTGDFDGGSLVYYDVTMACPSDWSDQDIVGANTFNTLAIADKGMTINLISGTTTTVADFTGTGSPGEGNITFQAKTADTIATIAKTGGGTVEEDYLDVIDITGTPATTWYYGTNGSGDNATGWTDEPGAAATRRIWLLI